VILGPELLNAVLHERDILDSFPAEKGIVTDEWCTITASDGKSDEKVDEVGEISN
jgi:hypothetical protein